MYKIIAVDRVTPGMDYSTNSQLTLIDTDSPAPLGENIVLMFDRDDMSHTTLRIRGDHLPSYSVDTQDYTTTVYAEDILLATVTRKKFRRDQITFPGSRPMNLGSWLKAPVLSTLPLVFHACGKRFEWRRDLSGQLVLHESSHPDDIKAWFSESRTTGHGNHVVQAAYLAIKPEMAEMRDTIVLSCLLAEHKLRIIDVLSDAQSRAAMYWVVF